MSAPRCLLSLGTTFANVLRLLWMGSRHVQGSSIQLLDRNLADFAFASCRSTELSISPAVLGFRITPAPPPLTSQLNLLHHP